MKYRLIALITWMPLVLTPLMGQDACPGAVSGAGGFAWIDPAVPDVNDSVYVYVDVSLDPNCQKLASSDGPLYLWTWGPVEPADGNGNWNNSNEANVLEHVEGTIWRFGMVPTEFYGVEADEIYDKGLCFLVKEKDGGSGGDCSEAGEEFKTADIYISVPSPFVKERKVYSYPDVVDGDTLLSRPDDVFTLIYDNKLEEKESMQNVDELFVYFRLEGDDGQNYTVSRLNQVGSNPGLRMTNAGNGIFQYSIIPSQFLEGVLPEGVQVQRMRFQLIRVPLCGADCAVDDSFFFTYKCLD